MISPLKVVAVSGASGFIGAHVAQEAENRGYKVIRGYHNRKFAGDGWRRADLRIPEEAHDFIKGADTVIHCAALVGTLVFKMQQPAKIMADNIRMTTNLVEAMPLVKAKRLVFLSSAEIYTGENTLFEEADGFIGSPNGANAGYVWSKRAAEAYVELAARQYGVDVGIVRPSNIFGPGDDYETSSARAIPSMIINALTGKDLVIWGDGLQERSFLYITDLSKAIMDVAERGLNQGPINLGSLEYIRLRDLASLVVSLTEGSSSIIFDHTMPPGPSRRAVGVSKARELISFSPSVNLAQGIAKCVADARARLSLAPLPEK